MVSGVSGGFSPRRSSSASAPERPVGERLPERVDVEEVLEVVRPWWRRRPSRDRGEVNRRVGPGPPAVDGVREVVEAGTLKPDPAQRVGELPLLTEAERRQLLEEWNATSEDRGCWEVF